MNMVTACSIDVCYMRPWREWPSLCSTPLQLVQEEEYVSDSKEKLAKA